MRYYFVSILLLLIHIFAYGQNTGSITGKAIDNEKNSIEFVNVFLTSVNDTTTIVNGTVTDSTGSFALTNLPLGEYVIHFQFIGFVKQKQPVSLSAENKNLKLGNIVLAFDITDLNSVEVTAIRNLIKKTEEGIVMNASENITQIGGTAADLPPQISCGPRA